MLSGQKIVWAKDQAKVHHIGWFGYHRPHGIRLHGPLSERYSALTKIITDPARLKKVARDFNDIHILEPWRHDESYEVTEAP